MCDEKTAVEAEINAHRDWSVRVITRRGTLFAVTAIGVVLGCVGVRNACGPAPVGRMVDGAYQGAATKGPVKAVVEVTVKGGRIAEIELLHHRRWRGGIAEKTIPERIVAAQSTRVDAVTGATVSSDAIMQAVQNAVSKAAAAAHATAR